VRHANEWEEKNAMVATAPTAATTSAVISAKALDPRLKLDSWTITNVQDRTRTSE
jgi:hypothetical protein